MGLLSLADLAARLGRRSRSSAAARATARRATARCAPRSTGASGCSRPQSAGRSRISRSSPAAPPLPPERVTGATLDTLDSLLAKQLLVRRGDRLLMLETVREYALELSRETPVRRRLRSARLVGHRLRPRGDAPSRQVRPDPVAARLDAGLRMSSRASWRSQVTAPRARTCTLSSELGAYWWRTQLWRPGLVWIDATIAQIGGGTARARAAALPRSGAARQVAGSGATRPICAPASGSSVVRYNGGIAACLGCLANVGGCCTRGLATPRRSAKRRAFAPARRDEEVSPSPDAAALTVAGIRGDAHAPPPCPGSSGRIGNLLELGNLCVDAGYLAIIEHRYDGSARMAGAGLEAAGLERSGAPFFCAATTASPCCFSRSSTRASVRLATRSPSTAQGAARHRGRGAVRVAGRRGSPVRGARALRALAGAAERHTPSVSRAPGEL